MHGQSSSIYAWFTILFVDVPVLILKLIFSWVTEPKTFLQSTSDKLIDFLCVFACLNDNEISEKRFEQSYTLLIKPFCWFEIIMWFISSNFDIFLICSFCSLSRSGSNNKLSNSSRSFLWSKGLMNLFRESHLIFTSLENSMKTKIFLVCFFHKSFL
jgi:hypothetical protein